MTRHRTAPFGVLVLSAIAIAAIGCPDADPVICPTYVANGLSVSVLNDQTGQPICDATVTAREGAYSETLMGGVGADGCRYVGAIERVGTYSVEAQRSGFSPATVSNLEVVSSGGDCPHVQTVGVVIRLSAQPIPPSVSRR